MKMIQRMISVAAALLTTVSAMSISTLTAAAASQSDDNYVLSAADIDLLHSMGTTDEDIARILQHTATRSSTQLNHYVCFIVNNDASKLSTDLHSEVYYPGFVYYHDCVNRLDDTPVSATSTRNSLNWNNIYYDEFLTEDLDMGTLAQLRYTSAWDDTWDDDLLENWNLNASNHVLIGDLDGNGELGIADLQKFAYILVYHSAPSGTVDNWENVADIDADFGYDQDDYDLLSHYLTGTIDTFWS